jgi:hypothetical protein
VRKHPPPCFEKVVAVSNEFDYGDAVNNDGKVICWGEPELYDGQYDPPSDLVVIICVCVYSSCET